MDNDRSPVNNGHYFSVPRVAVVHRFDCISNSMKKKHQLPKIKSYFKKSHDTKKSCTIITWVVFLALNDKLLRH